MQQHIIRQSTATPPDRLYPYDVNGDRAIDGQDLAGWMSGFGTEQGASLADGDDNLDGDVDGKDFFAWQLNYREGVVGDFNGSGAVDAGDLSQWEMTLGAGGRYDGRSFLTWQQNFGAAETLAVTAAVPEPATMWLGLVALVGLCGVVPRY